MGIFALSKDQTFRICAIFLDPAKFSILVIHLIQSYYRQKDNSGGLMLEFLDVPWGPLMNPKIFLKYLVLLQK
jgi:hypothetical protein